MVDNGRPVKHVTVGVKLGVGVFVVLLSLFACNLAKAVSSTSLEWNPNADPSVAGYNVYYGGASRTYTNVINAGNSTNAVIDGLVEGKTYYFAVTAYTYDGAESDYSDEFVYIVPGFLTLTPGGASSSPMQVRFPVAVGHSYELQQSTDLVHWTTIWQTLGINNEWVEYDTAINGSGAVFYRVVLH
jgi:hypothetical protein